MPLDTYANLKAAINSRSKISGITDSMLDDYIDQCEAEMYFNAQAPIMIRSMEARATATLSTTSRFYPLPDLFLRMRRLKINQPSTGDVDHNVLFLAPEQMPLANLTQIPQYFTVTTQLEFDSTPDDDYTAEMQYVKKLTPLSSSATTNDILTNHPNVYLFGSLWALFQDQMEFEQAEYYYQRFINAIDGANQVYQDARYGPAPVIRGEGYYP